MFYEPKKRNHGLPFDPFKGIVAPRPIGWISTVSAAGAFNLAPYSFFNAVSTAPPIVMFSSDGDKDSSRNAQETGEFCCNLVTFDLLDQMNESSAPYPHGLSEFGATGLTPLPGSVVRAPRVKEARAVLECKVTEIIRPRALDGAISPNVLVFGEVVGVHLDDAVLVNGMIDTKALRIVSRLGYKEYAVIDSIFELGRPKGGGDLERLK